MHSNRLAYEKFDDHLRLKQTETTWDQEFDIREWILENRFAQWGVGYTNENLERKYGANLQRLFPNAIGFQDKQFGRDKRYLVLGTVYKDEEKSHKGAVAALGSLNTGDTLVFFEQGFLASSHSWSESFRGASIESACLGYVYDDIAHYFMADYPNRLIHRLNSDHSLDDAEIARAECAMRRIVQEKISKYNSQPIYEPTQSQGYTRRVLVCDQAFADASTIYGKLTQNDFEQMLLAAIRENPDAEILVKTHPDTFWENGKRVGYYNHLQDVGRVRILRDPINPFSLFEQVDKVYVGSSQMGLEALFAGKEVVVFGAPFYAGWGLTDDRQAVPHRYRKRSLAEVFHYFYIWYTIYHVPGCAVPSQIEDVLDYIVSKRPSVQKAKFEQPFDRPKISVVLPVWGVEKYIEECLHSIQSQTLQELEIIPVNDCSPDGSQAIIDRLAAEDRRIRPIKLESNVGQGFARNVGIDAARGKYIFFLDSDDLFLEQDVLHKAFEAAEADESDLVRVQKWVFKDGMNPETAHVDGGEANFPVREVISGIKSSRRILLNWHFWNFLYRTSLLKENGVKFKTAQWEERAFVCQAFRHAEKISCLPIRAIGYRKRTGSTMGRSRSESDFDMLLSNVRQTQIALQGTEGERFGVFQLANIFTMGEWNNLTLTLAKDKGVPWLLERLHDAFRAGELPENWLAGKSELSNVDMLNKKRDRLGLFVAALAAKHAELLDVALRDNPIEQARLIQIMQKVPEAGCEQRLQDALSYYARNEKVLISSCVKAEVDHRGIRVLIHIGSTKTGSTFIQHFLESNRAALLRAGIYVPEIGLFWQESRPHKQAGHSDFVPEAVRGKNKLKDHVERTLALCEGGVHTVILTSEAFFLNSRSIELARQFSDYKVEMLGYIRRQDEWANSQYAEFVAGGAVVRVDETLEEWLKSETTRNRMDYLATLKLWESVVGRENIRLGIYDRADLRDGDIVSDFLTLAGLENLINLPRPAAVQENKFPFCTGHVKIIRRLNSGPWPDREAYFQFIEEAGRRVTEIRQRTNGPAPRVNMIDDRTREELIRTFETSNQEIAKYYLGREDGQLFRPFTSGHPDDSDLVSVDEIDAIMSAHEKWAAKSGPTVTARNWSATLKGSQDFLVNKTFVYRVYRSLGRRIMRPKMAKKLETQPDKFFADSRNPLTRVAYGLIGFEKALRGNPAPGTSPLPVEKTFTARAFRMGSRYMADRKAVKLTTNPDAFFSDMKGRAAPLVRAVLRAERQLRARPVEAAE